MTTQVQTNPHPSVALQSALSKVVSVSSSDTLKTQEHEAKRSLKGRLVVKSLPKQESSNLQGLQNSAKKLVSTLQQITKGQSEASLEKLAAKIFEQTLNLLSEVEILLVRMQNKNYQNQLTISKTTVHVTHEVTQKQIKDIKVQLAEYEKAEHTSKIMKIVGIVASCLALAISAALGAGAFIACAALVALQESGGMNKMTNGLPLFAKIGVCVALGIALGAAAGSADAAMFTAEESAAGAGAAGAADDAASEGPKTTLDAFKGGAKFGLYNGTSQMLASTNSIQELTEKVFGKNDFSNWLGMVLSIILAISAAVAGGTGGARGGLAGQVSAKFGKDAGQSMTMTRVFSTLQTFQAGATVGTMIAEIQAANNYRNMSKTAKNIAPILELEILLKSITTLMQVMEQQSTKLMKDDAKRFESDVKNLASIALPYQAQVRVLNASAA